MQILQHEHIDFPEELPKEILGIVQSLRRIDERDAQEFLEFCGQILIQGNELQKNETNGNHDMAKINARNIEQHLLSLAALLGRIFPAQEAARTLMDTIKPLLKLKKSGIDVVREEFEERSSENPHPLSRLLNTIEESRRAIGNHVHIDKLMGDVNE